MVLGTPEYMALELIMGDPFDGRADQYALAITVYELLCGRRPFEDDTKTKVLVLHTSKAPAPLTAWCQTLPLALSQAVLKGLAEEPSQRYATCGAFATAAAAAAGISAIPEERIRLKCTSCGKTGSLPVGELARLKAGGGRATCPACKSPIDIGSAVEVAPGPTTGATMKFAISDPSGGYAQAGGPNPGRGYDAPGCVRSSNASATSRPAHRTSARRDGNADRTNAPASRSEQRPTAGRHRDADRADAATARAEQCTAAGWHRDADRADAAASRAEQPTAAGWYRDPDRAHDSANRQCIAGAGA